MTVNYFELFGLMPSVDVDVPSLEQKFRELALQHHPDRQASSDSKVRRMAVETTANLNDAIKTLRDENKRYVYLLRLHGVDLDSNDAITQRSLPVSFLEEVMEQREALQEARQNKDLKRAQSMAKSASTELQNTLATAKKNLKTLLSEPKNDAAKNHATEALERTRYYARMVEEAEAMEEELLE